MVKQSLGNDSLIVKDKDKDKGKGVVRGKWGKGLVGALDGFDRFWNAYPKKRGKGDAEKAWGKIRPDAALVEKMMGVIEKARRSVDWLKEGGQFVPYPATWLNRKGWEDVIENGPQLTKAQTRTLIELAEMRKGNGQIEAGKVIDVDGKSL